MKSLIIAALFLAPISAFSYETDKVSPESHLCPEFAKMLAKTEIDVKKAAGVTAKGDSSTQAD